MDEMTFAYFVAGVRITQFELLCKGLKAKDLGRNELAYAAELMKDAIEVLKPFRPAFKADLLLVQSQAGKVLTTATSKSRTLLFKHIHDGLTLSLGASELWNAGFVLGRRLPRLTTADIATSESENATKSLPYLAIEPGLNLLSINLGELLPTDIHNGPVQRIYFDETKFPWWWRMNLGILRRKENAVPEAPRQPKPRIRIDLIKCQVVFDEVTYPVSSKDARVLQILADNYGNYVSSTEMMKADPLLRDQRVDRIIKRFPSEVRRFLASSSKGYRIQDDPVE